MRMSGEPSFRRTRSIPQEIRAEQKRSVRQRDGPAFRGMDQDLRGRLV
jgi:hypothetical protein